MPWPITLYKSFEEACALFGNNLPVGTMYPDSDWLERSVNQDGANRKWLSPEYERDWAAKRAPLSVVLPCGDFMIDTVTISDGKLGDHGWQVSGEPPALTLVPSVNIKGGWHGFIQNGVISDDVEGRTFPTKTREGHPVHVEHSDSDSSAPDSVSPSAPAADAAAPDAAAPATPAVETGTSEAPFPAPLPTLDDIVAQLEDGDAILRQGKGWGVVRRGEYGYGNSPVEAHANIGAVQLNGHLHRRDGSVVKL